MGMNIGKNIVENLPQMNKAAETKLTGIEQKPQTIKNTDVKFPEEKPDVQKTHYDSRKEFDEAMKNGTAKAGDTYFQNSIMYYVDEIKEDGTHTRHDIGWRTGHSGIHTVE